MDYTYNIRGWLKKINEPDLSGGEGDFFGAELLYNEGFEALNGTAMNGAAMYNGNISGIKWKNGSSGSAQKGYGFIYDQINRLTTSKYGEGTSYTTNVNRYDENLTYDKNGNIRKLFRNGQISTGVFGNIDSLGYKYPGTGNQLWATGDIVTDVAGRGDFFDGTNGYSTKEYYYDKNGNIWLDRNKKMKTLYNYLNLPSRVSDTITPANKIEYVYTSAGEKLKQRLSTGTTLLYNGNFVYTLDGTANGIVVKYILTAEGRANYLSGAYTYEYFMKDHLGNTRTAFDVPSGVAVITQQDDYYPFGMLHQPQDATTSDNRYLYNGKEFQNNLLGGINLDLYDYGARFYDPQIGRFNSIDPLMEWHFNYTPYHYTFNNPINFLDPFGQDTVKSGEVDWPKFNPDIDIIELPGASVSSEGYTWFGRLLRKIGRAINSGGNSTYTQPYGEPWTSDDGQGQETAKAKIMGPGGNIDPLLNVNPKAGPLDLPGTRLERFNEGLEYASGAIQEATPDRQIVEQSTGTAEKTDAHGKPIEQTEYDYKSEGKESDSSVVQVTYYFNDVDGDTVQDWKVKKNTSNGRPVSKKYVKKTK